MSSTKPANVGCVLKHALDNFFSQYSDVQTAQSIAVAVSGGPDSMALADSLINVFSGSLRILCVDHGLRESSKDEAALLKKWVADLNRPNVSLDILKWQNNNSDTAIMEKARAARYDLMADFCDVHKVKYLFVAHHQDDQAETFLIRLIAGSGLDGLAAMNEVHSFKDIQIMRPFLSCAKQDLIDYCQGHNVPFSTDPSNKNDEFLRPRLRENFPALAAEGLSVKRLNVAAKRLRRARNALETITNNAFDDTAIKSNEQEVFLDYAKFVHYPEEIAFRLVQKSLEHFRFGQPYHVRMDKLENLFDSLWRSRGEFKARTLGGVKILLNKKNERLVFEKEK